MGDKPSQPELLDHMASRFMRDGWSIKHLVRTLVLTRAYQLSSAADANAKSADPSNRLIWRHTSRRLDAEEMRDAMLAVAGNLNMQRPAGSAAQTLKMIEMRDNGPEAGAMHDRSDRSLCRSVYLPLVRGVTPRALEAFDPVDQTLVSGNRDATTVPAQALYLLNSPFVRRQALTLAERILKAKDGNDAARVAALYRLVLGRAPMAKESDRVLAFLAEYESTFRALPTPAPLAKAKPTGPAKPAEVPANPDEVDQTGEPITEDVIRPKDAKTAAWLALAQALLGSVEFRYLP
jgi:hypothetical protein